MPTYQVTAANRLLTRGEKQALAEAITAAHATCTGAPAYFAQVTVHELGVGESYIGGKENTTPLIFVHGLIRAGRAGDAKRALCERIVCEVAQILQLSQEDVWVYLQDIAAGQMVEFGRTLPEPGHETSWTEAMSSEKRTALKATGLDL